MLLSVQIVPEVLDITSRMSQELFGIGPRTAQRGAL
jgi:hypothetical protein